MVAATFALVPSLGCTSVPARQLELQCDGSAIVDIRVDGKKQWELHAKDGRAGPVPVDADSITYEGFAGGAHVSGRMELKPGLNTIHLSAHIFEDAARGAGATPARPAASPTPAPVPAERPAGSGDPRLSDFYTKADLEGPVADFTGTWQQWNHPYTIVQTGSSVRIESQGWGQLGSVPTTGEVSGHVFQGRNADGLDVKMRLMPDGTIVGRSRIEVGGPIRGFVLTRVPDGRPAAPLAPTPAPSPAAAAPAAAGDVPASWDDLYTKADLFADLANMSGAWMPTGKIRSRTMPDQEFDWGSLLVVQTGEDVTATWVKSGAQWTGKVRGRVFRGTIEGNKAPCALKLSPDGRRLEGALMNFTGMVVFSMVRSAAAIADATKGDAPPPSGPRPSASSAPAPAQPAPAPPAATGGTYVLVVGIDATNDAKIPRLRFAEADARAVYSFFATEDRSPTDGDRVTLLLGEKATRVAILRAIREKLVLKARRPEDTAILYFAGHGFADATDTFLASADTELDLLHDTAIPSASLRSLWSEIPAGRKVLLLDACHSGGVQGLRGIGGVTLAPAAPAPASAPGAAPASGPTSVTIAASGPNELSAEDENLGHGVFTTALLNGLRGEADRDHDGRVTADELGRYLVEHVPPLAARAHGKQTPVVDATQGSEALFLTR